ncbi:hypothetical protein IF1G_06656 [Cordyceps javanica]|uniref:BZIP domain-containing protein n=1 Tax=Cordyceps javanica TaxID=43265 RepID=A0A545UYS9_9HYPO|nr:hypothetical protein IF1G_06656 [Cordyceps javanica]
MGVVLGRTLRSAKKPFLYSPANDAVEYYIGEFSDGNDPHGKYVGEPRPSLEKAWGDLLGPMNIRLSLKDVQAFGREATAVDHCLSTLKSFAMCHGDVGLVIYSWQKDLLKPGANGTGHTCVNWDKLAEWTKERTVNMYQPGLIIHPQLDPSPRYVIMHSAEITDAAAKLEEQRRRNRLAQRRRRERQKNRAASINSISNDALSTILSEAQDHQSEKAWEFAVESAFFDPSLEEQDELTDQCLQGTPPLSSDVHHTTEQAETGDSVALPDRPESMAKSLLDRQLVSIDVSGDSTNLDSSSPSPLRQILMTLQKGDRELSQDSYSRLLAMFSQTQQSQNHRYEGLGCKPQQPINTSDFMQLSNDTPVCISSASGSSATTGSGSFSWPRSESRPLTASRSADSAAPNVSLERIREFVEDAGFESLEAMMTAYYSTNLGARANSRPAQAVGRSRRLRGFLSAIHRSHVEWGEQERNAYREEIVRAAEGIYADELLNMARGATETSKSILPSIAGSSRPTAETSRVYIAHRIQNLIADQEIQDFMRKDRKDLQDTVADTWSLLMQLIHNTGQSPQQKASNACIILYLLTSPAI